MKKELSNGEWTLMKLIWDHPPKTIKQLSDAVKDTTRLSKRNVITMLDRMQEKGAVFYRYNGRAREYWPRIRQEDAAWEETERFLDRVFSGRLGLLLHTALDSRGMTEEEIDELSEILRRAKEELHHGE